MKNIKKILLCSTLAFILGFASIANVNAKAIIAKTFGGGSWLQSSLVSADNEEECKAKNGTYIDDETGHSSCLVGKTNDIITLGTFTYNSDDNYIQDMECYTPLDLNSDGKVTADEPLQLLQMIVGSIDYDPSTSDKKGLNKLYEDVCVNHKDEELCAVKGGYFNPSTKKPGTSLALMGLQVANGTSTPTYFCRVQLKQKEDGSYYYPQFWMKYSSNYMELNMPSETIKATETDLPYDNFFSTEFTDKVKMRIDKVGDKYELFIYDINASKYDKVLTTEKPLTYATIGDIKSQIDEALKLGDDEYLYINGLNTGLKICKKDNKDDCLGVFVGDDGYLYINGKRVADLTKNASSKVEWKDECLYIDDESKFCKGDTGTTSNPKTGVATSIILAGTVVIAVTVGTTIVLKRKYMKNI